MAYYDSNVYSLTSFNPVPLTMSLSAADSSVVLETVGTLSGRTLVGLAFNRVTSPTAQLVTLSAGTGIRFRVSTSYDQKPMLAIWSDRQTSFFTCNTAFGTTRRQNLSAVAPGNAWPEFIRGRNQENY